MKNKVKKLIKKYKDLIPYAIFGVLTTIVNIAVYALCAHVFHLSTIISTAIAWLISVIFAYLTNRKWVFFSDAKTGKEIFNEALSFFYCRLGTGIIDILIMWFFVDRLHFPDIWIKVFANIVVIILNYVASKWLIFKHGEKGREANKELSILVTVLGVIALLAILIAEYSPLAPWHSGNAGIDESVYKYVAVEMEHGNMPYLDTFDHKGPLLYLIYWFGALIAPWRGVWCLNVVAIFATILFAYLSARKFKLNHVKSMICALISAVPLCFIYSWDPSGQPQIFALPLIAYSIYVFMDYYKNNVISWWKLMLCGICMGATSMLLANLVVIWGVLALLAIICCAKRKEARRLIGYIAWFILGIVIVLTPILIWLGVNGAIQPFVESYLLFNVSYTNSYAGIGSNISIFMDFLQIELALICIIYLIYRVVKERDYTDIAALVILVTVYVVASMSGRFSWHYALIIIPALFYPVALMMKEFSANKNALLIVIGYILVAIALPQWVAAGKNMAKAYNERFTDQAALSTNAVSKVVLENSDENDRITVIGNNDIIYLRTNRMSASRYSFQHPLVYIDDDVKPEYLEDLRNNLPELVIIEMNAFPDEKGEDFMNDVNEFLNTEGYQEIWQTPDTPEYNSWPYKIYKH